MASEQALISGQALVRQKAFSFAAVTAFPAMQIQYCGAYAYAKIAVAAGGDVTITADDTDGTTALYTIDLSTPAAGLDTYGELRAYINGLPDLRCNLLGVLPSASTDNTLATLAAAHLKTGATQAIQENGKTLLIDQAVLLDVGFCISGEKFISQPDGGYSTKRKGWIRQTHCINYLDYLYASIATQAQNGSIKVYSVNDEDQTSYLLWSNAYAAGTAEEHPGAAPRPMEFLQSNEGERLVVIFDAVDTAMSGTLDVHGFGRTKNLIGDPVYGSNYDGCR